MQNTFEEHAGVHLRGIELGWLGAGVSILPEEHVLLNLAPEGFYSYLFSSSYFCLCFIFSPIDICHSMDDVRELELLQSGHLENKFRM